MLVSNFNAKESAKESGQGTGTTIVQVSAAGKVTLFAKIDPKTLPGPCPGGVGLTTALDILPGGYVVVGSLPTTNGKTATAKYGCLIVLNSEGKPVKTIASKNIQGPWDSTAKSEGSKTTLFVSNALNGGAVEGEKPINNSTVLRIDLESGEGHVAEGAQRTARSPKGSPGWTRAEALVLGPTGLALASQRHALRRLHAKQQDPRDPRSRDPHDRRAGRRHRPHRRRSPQGTSRDGAGAQRQHHHHQRRRRQHGRDHTGRPANRGPDRRQEDRRRLAVRPRDQPERRTASTTWTTAKTQ